MREEEKRDDGDEGRRGEGEGGGAIKERAKKCGTSRWYSERTPANERIKQEDRAHGARLAGAALRLR